jgi:TRAP transporter TAXI family solute receptor
MNHRRISRRTLLCGLGLSVLATGCSAPAPRTWTLGGGEAGGYFAEFAQLLADTARETGSPVRLAPRVSTGSLENVQRIVSGEFDFGLALTDSIGENAVKLRAVARVYQTYWQLLVRKDSPVATVADLARLRMSLGPDGSGTQFTARRMLSVAGLEPTDITEAPMTVTDSARALIDQDIDAALVAGGVPLPAVEEVAGSNVRLICLRQETTAMIERYGAGYFPVRIPAGVYGTAGATESLGVSSLLVCSPNVPDEAVGQVVRLLIDYPDRLVPEQTLGTQYLDPRSMIYAAGLALHPGAAQVYREHHG